MSTATDVIAVTFSGASLGVSGWAGFTAHKARTWQRRRDEERLATRVRLEFVHGTRPADVPLVSHGGPVPEPERIVTVGLIVINDGEAPEYVTAAFLEEATDRSSKNGIRIFGSEGGIEDTDAHEVRPRASKTFTVDLEPENLDWMRHGFVGAAWLGSGQHVTSSVEYPVGGAEDDD